MNEKDLIAEKENEWIGDYNDFKKLAGKWLDETTHILFGKVLPEDGGFERDEYFVFRTFTIGNKASLSVDFEGDEQAFFVYLMRNYQGKHPFNLYNEKVYNDAPDGNC